MTDVTCGHCGDVGPVGTDHTCPCPRTDGECEEHPCSNHHPIQHRDARPAWCHACGRTAVGDFPKTRLEGRL